jgi:hypothetical protein
MKVRIPEGKSRLLVVEGKEDQEFFIQLAKHMDVLDGWPLLIEQLEGKSNFREYLLALTRHPRFGKLSAIGIVRDADFGTNSFQSVQDTIRSANRMNARQLPVPQQVMEFAPGTPNTGVLILPSSHREGMIEDLVMDLFQDDPVNLCVETFFTCLRENSLPISQERLPKARLRTFITGKNAGFDEEEANGGDADRQFLSDVFHMSWWEPEFWDHPIFDDAKTFLTQLLAP